MEARRLPFEQPSELAFFPSYWAFGRPHLKYGIMEVARCHRLTPQTFIVSHSTPKGVHTIATCVFAIWTKQVCVTSMDPKGHTNGNPKACLNRGKSDMIRRGHATMLRWRCTYSSNLNNLICQCNGCGLYNQQCQIASHRGTVLIKLNRRHPSVPRGRLQPLTASGWFLTFVIIFKKRGRALVLSFNVVATS